MPAFEVPVYYFLATLLISGVGSTCVPTECLMCEISSTVQQLNYSSDVCNICTNITSQCFEAPDIPANCKKDFRAYLNSTSSYALAEGDELVLRCHHDLPPPLGVVFSWRRDGRTVAVQNASELRRTVYVKHRGAYRCVVHSPCGDAMSNERRVEVNDSAVLLVVLCVFCAVVLVLAMGATMRCKLQKANAAQRRRQEQRAQILQMTSGMPPRQNHHGGRR